MESIWKFFVNRGVFTSLVIVALVSFGFMSIISIPKESAPEVEVPIMVVTTIYPGASALDVEELITNKIEDQLSGSLDDIDSITSSSQEGVSSVVVEFDASANVDKSLNKTKDEVDKVVPLLPQDAEDPRVVNVDFSGDPVMLVSITSDLPVLELIDLVDDVESELKKVSGVSKVSKSGIREREVQVIVRKEDLNRYGVSLSSVVGAISQSNSSLPVGSIELDGIDYTVRFNGDIENPSEVKDIAIFNQAGEPVYLRDIAFVSDGVSRARTFSRVSVDGSISEQAVSLSIFKKSGGDITKITDGVIEKFEELQSEGGLLESSDVLVTFNAGDQVKNDLKNLSFTGLQTVILVMIILYVAIGWRESVVAGIAIPLSFLIAFIGLSLSGNTINFVSLFSLILAVGILVDSAIVITEGIHLRISDYPRRRDAALATIKEFHWPLTSGTMTTIAVFIPLFLISGITGEFIASIPFTIIFVLAASLFVALAIVPLLSAVILQKKTEHTKFGDLQEKYTKKFQDWYRSKLVAMLGNKKREILFIISLIVALIVTSSFPVIGLVKTIFFEQEDSDWIFLNLSMPEGTILGRTDIAIREVEDILYEEDEISSFVTSVGEANSFASSDFGGAGGGGKLANITIVLREDRDRKSTEILESLRAKTDKIKNAEISYTELSSGPPSGAPITVRFLGDSLEDLEETTKIAEDVFSKIEGTVDINTSTKDNGLEFTLSINRPKSAELGVSTSLIAQTLRTAVNGVTATTIRTDSDDIDVVVKLDLNANFLDTHDTARTTIEAIEYIEVPTQNGFVYLGSLLEPSLSTGNSVIRHEDTKRVATVTSDVREGYVTSEILREFTDKWETLEVPTGVTMKIGGEAEDINQSFKEMGLSLIVGMVLVLAILVLQFNSYKQAFFIIIIVPFSLIGIFIGLAISGQPLSFPSMMGYIALSGIVVNNSIILIDRMNSLRRENPNMPIDQVVLEGATSRLRPILLTTLTTVIGIIPLTYSSELWSPLAFAIMFGLSFAVVITLILVPVLYHRWPGKLE